MSLNKQGADNECIQVVARCRPLNKKEIEEKRSNIITIDTNLKQISIRNPEPSKDNSGDDIKTFTYDAAYDEFTKQKVFYDESCFGIIESALEGFNSTIFAYGQTGCGKSFTMQGPTADLSDDMKGVIPNSFSHIFQFIKDTKDVEFLIRCSYLELYNEEILDLLGNPKNKVKCELKEDAQKGVFIKNLENVVVETQTDLENMLNKGLGNRTVAATLMNAESSRSHSIFTIIIEMSSKDKNSGKEMVKVGKLNLVDLAGSERQKKTGTKDAALKEGIKINLSLSALGNVISALSEGSKHIPYRDSKLTRLLQDSLGGNSKTMMIAAFSPADYNFDETLSTLRYANRAKNIKNKPKINEDPKDTIIREFKEEIEKLKQMLSEQANKPKDTHLNINHHISNDIFDVNNNHITTHNNSNNNNNDSHIESKNKKSSSEEEHTNMNHKVKEVHDLLREKEYEIEMERQMREELNQRLQQLQHMLVSNKNKEQTSHFSENSILESPTGTEMVTSPSLQFIEEEDEAQIKYKEKKLKSKKKKEMQQEEEMRRIVEEKRLMEEELEELRLSAISLSSQISNNNNNNSAISNNYASNANLNDSNDYNVIIGDDSLEKKLFKMKKKYEKKLFAADEELQAMREDFYYQRKQLMDAALEQEKDTKLFEQICLSVLDEKDLKKIVDKSRYDDEKEEWIIPYSKKKSLESIESKNNNNSLLPDINKSSYLNKVSLGLISNNEKQNNEKDHFKSLSTAKGFGLIPLLNLPGGLTSASTVSNTPVELMSYRPESGQINSNNNDISGIGFIDQSENNEGKKKKNKNKPPKNPNKMAETQLLPLNDIKLSGRQSASISNDNNNDNYSYNKKDNTPVEGLLDEAGTGKTAGPIDDWGFANDLKGNIKPELEYSDDEDFEVADDNNNNSNNNNPSLHPHPPSYSDSKQSIAYPNRSNETKAKKKKNKKIIENSDPFAQTTVLLKQSPRAGALPPI